MHQPKADFWAGKKDPEYGLVRLKLENNVKSRLADRLHVFGQ